MKKLINLLMVLLFVSAMVSCGGNAETDAPVEDTVDTMEVPAEDMDDSTNVELDSTDAVKEEETGH